MKQAELEALVERIAVAERQAQERLAHARQDMQERLKKLAEEREAEHRRQVAELEASLKEEDARAKEALEREVQGMRGENAAYIERLKARGAEVRRAIIAWAIARVTE